MYLLLREESELDVKAIRGYYRFLRCHKEFARRSGGALMHPSLPHARISGVRFEGGVDLMRRSRQGDNLSA